MHKEVIMKDFSSHRYDIEAGTYKEMLPLDHSYSELGCTGVLNSEGKAVLPRITFIEFLIYLLFPSLLWLEEEEKMPVEPLPMMQCSMMWSKTLGLNFHPYPMLSCYTLSGRLTLGSTCLGVMKMPRQ